jgi:antitoxin (DNA-binding transcriptional repressor) of toxin-antitoxin stability system
MMQATVSRFKARLSAFLAAVRGGETVIVCDRKTPIARVVPLTQVADDLSVEEPIGELPSLKQLRAVRLRRKVDVVRLLRADRDQR